MSRFKRDLSPQAVASYQQRGKAQCLAWAQGRPFHEPVNDECTPDFSCCFPDMFECSEVKRWQHYREKYGEI